ncbi:hypothetical protein DBR06_SOUSAS11910013, partial [Sousa chinensis]
GVLACLDGYMNIALEQTEEYVNGQLKNKYGDAFIRGNNADNSSQLAAGSVRGDRMHPVMYRLHLGLGHATIFMVIKDCIIHLYQCKLSPVLSDFMFCFGLLSCSLVNLPTSRIDSYFKTVYPKTELLTSTNTDGRHVL